MIPRPASRLTAGVVIVPFFYVLPGPVFRPVAGGWSVPLPPAFTAFTPFQGRGFGVFLALPVLLSVYGPFYKAITGNRWRDITALPDCHPRSNPGTSCGFFLLGLSFFRMLPCCHLPSTNRRTAWEMLYSVSLPPILSATSCQAQPSTNRSKQASLILGFLRLSIHVVISCWRASYSLICCRSFAFSSTMPAALSPVLSECHPTPGRGIPSSRCDRAEYAESRIASSRSFSCCMSASSPRSFES